MALRSFMLKKFIFLFLISNNCFAQNAITRDQVGLFLAECSAYMLHASFLNTNAGDIPNANMFRENRRLAMDMAEKYIGNSRASERAASKSKVIAAYQSNSNAYFQYIFSGVKSCNEFSIQLNNNSSFFIDLLR
jgi:hypothetical protein